MLQWRRMGTMGLQSPVTLLFVPKSFQVNIIENIEFPYQKLIPLPAGQS